MKNNDIPPDADTVRQWLGAAGRIAVLTGAGISAESGVPTFRDAQSGYWAQFRAEDMATEAGFCAHPERVWDWYQHRRAMLAAVEPNAGHRALAGFAARWPASPRATPAGSPSSRRTWTGCTSAPAARTCCACTAT